MEDQVVCLPLICLQNPKIRQSITNHQATDVVGTGANIVAQGESMSVLPRESTGTGDYYLAPSVKFAKVGLGNHVEELVYVDENGDNHYGLENIFKTELKTFGLNLYYDSSNARDNYNTMGHWRHSFVSSLDFDINEADLKDKSNFYETPREACESGFNDIKEDIYRGILSAATSVYDKNSDMCIIKQDGEDVGKFLVWNRAQKRDDVHYLTTDTGEFLVFVKNSDGNFTTEQNGITIALEEDVNGTFSYKDSKDVMRRYDANGRLVYLMDEGQETTVEYNANGDVSKVISALDTALLFSYNENNKLSKISTPDDIVKAEFEYNSNQMLSNYDFTVFDENNTANQLVDLNFVYNDKNLLSNVDSPEKISPEGESIPQILTEYVYDQLNRVISTSSNSDIEQYLYTSNKVVKTLSDGSTAEANIAYEGSKQVVKTMEDAIVATEMNYNDNGQLSEVILEEEIETNSTDTNSSDNIQSNSFTTKNTLRLQVDYNEKGLISSQYLESSDGTKKFSNYEYKTKYNKPTKVLTDEDVTFFDFNNKGQLIKKSYLKYDKDMKIKPHTLEEIKQEPGYEEVSYTYNSDGFLAKKTDGVTNEEINYYTTIEGKTQSGNIKSNFLWSWGSWWQEFIARLRNLSRPGFIDGVGTFDMRNNNTTQTAFIEGGGGGWMHNTVRDYANGATGGSKPCYYWWQQDGASPAHYRKTPKSDPFLKEVGKNLMVIGHSWGGDSAVEASNYASAGKGVDLLLTIDPVGTGNRWSDAKYWIEVYANPGRQWPGIKVKWKCRWWGCYPKFYHLKSEWNDSDWIAWSGGKGWYSSYDKGDAYPNHFYELRAHHGDFGYMLQELQNSRTNYRFNIDGAW